MPSGFYLGIASHFADVRPDVMSLTCASVVRPRQRGHQPLPLLQLAIVAVKGIHHDDGRDQQRDALLYPPRRAIPVRRIRVPCYHPAEQRPHRDRH